jgi:hypothetical protein
MAPALRELTVIFHPPVRFEEIVTVPKVALVNAGSMDVVADMVVVIVRLAPTMAVTFVVTDSWANTAPAKKTRIIDAIKNFFMVPPQDSLATQHYT